MFLVNRLTKAAAAPLFLAWGLFASCDREKGLLESVRKGEMEIVFGRNRAKNEAIVRNNIPVEIKVFLNSEKFGRQEVTDRVKWEYLDKTLGEVVYDSSLLAYVYLQNGTKTGRQKVTARLQGHFAEKEFEVSPVELAVIPGGTFMMGDSTGFGGDDEKPVHSVKVNTFSIGKYEVTNLEYLAFIKSAMKAQQVKIDRADIIDFHSNALYLASINSKIQIDADGSLAIAPGFENHPVTGVSWRGASVFAEYYQMVLPTEAEWEYACRGTTTTDYFFGNDPNVLPNYAWCKPADRDTTLMPVGGLLPNQFVLFDVYGNVNEWCYDFYEPNYYRVSPSDNPRGPNSSGTNEKVLRGGSFQDIPLDCRSAKRHRTYLPFNHNLATGTTLGFRVVKHN